MLITELKAKEAIVSQIQGKAFIINCHGCKEIHFPEHDAKYFFCDSWLLSPDLQEIMEPDANILQFSKLWDHIPFHPDHSEQAVRHLYGVNYKREDVVNAPEHTSLQRKAKARILAGGDINIGAGMRKI